LNPRAFELPFDQFQRYQLVAGIVGQVRPNAKPLEVLDVGGRTGLLRLFLPVDRITAVDTEAPSEGEDTPRMVLGTGCALPFQDDAFDVVCAFDTLEHVRPRGRRAFVRECARVCRRWLVIAGPYSHKSVNAAEAHLARFLELELGFEHRYLKEHLSNGLPDRAKVESWLAKDGAEVCSIGHGNVERWLALMLGSLAFDLDPDLRPHAKELFRFYNAELYAADREEPVYRHAVVAALDGASLPREEGLFDEHSAPAPERWRELAEGLSLGLHESRFKHAAERAEFELAVETLRVDLDGHQESLGELGQELGEHEAMVRKLEGELESAHADAAEMKAGLEADLAGHKASIEDEQRATEEQRALNEEQRTGFEATIEEQRGDSEEQDEVIATLRADLAGHKDSIEDEQRATEEQRALNEEQRTGFEATIEEQRRDSEVQDEVIATLEADLEGHKDSLEQEQRERSEAERAYAELEADLERQREERVEVIATLEADLEGHKDSLEQEQRERSEVERAYAELEADLERQREERMEVIATLEADLKGHKDSLAEGHAARVSAETAFAELEVELERREGVQAAELAAHEEVQSTLREELADHQHVIAEGVAEREVEREAAAEALRALDQEVGDERDRAAQLETETARATDLLAEGMLALEERRAAARDLELQLEQSAAVVADREGQLQEHREVLAHRDAELAEQRAYTAELEARVTLLERTLSRRIARGYERIRARLRPGSRAE